MREMVANRVPRAATSSWDASQSSGAGRSAVPLRGFRGDRQVCVAARSTQATAERQTTVWMYPDCISSSRNRST